MLCCVFLVLAICCCFSSIIPISCINFISNNASINAMMIVTDPSNILHAHEANESDNMRILMLINVIASHDDFPLGRVNN